MYYTTILSSKESKTHEQLLRSLQNQIKQTIRYNLETIYHNRTSSNGKYFKLETNGMIHKVYLIVSVQSKNTREYNVKIYTLISTSGITKILEINFVYYQQLKSKIIKLCIILYIDFLIIWLILICGFI